VRPAAALAAALLAVLGTAPDAVRAAEPAPATATTAPVPPAAVPADAPSGEFLTAYVAPANEDYRVYFEELRGERFLESVGDALNRVLVLPVPVTLELAECGHSTVSWDVPTHTVTVCYEFLDAVVMIAGSAADTQPRAEQLFSGAVTFALFAEIGEALVDLYGLPAPHGVPQAADEFAAITLAASERNGDAVSAAAIEFFDVALRKPDSGLEYLEARGFDRARLENVACIFYGNAPGNHAAAIAHAVIPAGRAPRCAEQVIAVAKTWDRNLHGHARAAGDGPPVRP
jgi:hypothetical protein